MDSLCQFFHLNDSWTIKAINLVNKNVYLNTHHPLLFTLVLGLVFKIGFTIKSFTLGAFIYTILQTVLSIIIFSFVMVYLKKINIPLWLRIFLLLFIGLCPTISAFTITAVKDTPSALFVLLYIIFLIQIIRNYESIFQNKIRVLFLIITMLLVIALRNNGIITILFSYPFLFLLYKKNWKKLLLVLIIPIAITLLFNNIMYSAFDVSKGSKGELFSVPFMQIARLIKNGYNKEFTKEDIKAIDKVLDYERIEQDYYPAIADAVKSEYNKDATNKDLKAFFNVWFKYLCKHPNVYIKSIMVSTYQYFYPGPDTGYGILGIEAGIQKNFDIKGLKKMDEPKRNLSYINTIISDIPIIGLFYKVAFYDWILITSCIYVIYKKKYKYLIALAPLISILLVCLASPLNGAMRYILPIVFSLPICVSINYLVYKESYK